MSSAEVQRGLLANCVASRVKALNNPAHRKLVWWLQKCSWEPGGLDKVAEEIIQRWPERFITRSMVKLGTEKGRVYDSNEVRTVRDEMPEGIGFPLRGEVSYWGGYEQIAPYDWELDRDDRANYRRARCRELRETRRFPRCYAASDFSEVCASAAAEGLGKFLFQELCLNPSVRLNESALWYLPSLVETLTEMHDFSVAQAVARAPQTEIGARVAAALDYALSGPKEEGEDGPLSIVDGKTRTGKSFAVAQWVEAHPGQARYCQTPSTNDDISFFRAICKSIGLGCGSAFKAAELREKIEDTLQGGDLLLVLDEGHYLWPQRNMRKAVPHRINWMRTQLVNKGVPVVVVTTPQFTRDQQTIAHHGGWWLDPQIVGRLTDYQKLPDTLGDEDLEKVALYWLPGGDAKSIRTLVAYAKASDTYLGGIKKVSRRAAYFAAKAKRTAPTFADVKAALEEGVCRLTTRSSSPWKTLASKAADGVPEPLVRHPCKRVSRRPQQLGKTPIPTGEPAPTIPFRHQFCALGTPGPPCSHHSRDGQSRIFKGRPRGGPFHVLPRRGNFALRKSPSDGPPSTLFAARRVRS